MNTIDVRGRMVWYELMTSDPKAAQAFYTTVLGWGTQAFDMPGQPYTMWTRGAIPIGGVMDLPEDARRRGVPPNWLMYAGTADVDETVAAATKLGATVLVPVTPIPGVGRFAVLQDPQGAVFAVHQSETPLKTPQAAPEIGDFSWHELATTDYKAALAFYGALFGWEDRGGQDMGPIGVYQMFGREGMTIGGMFNKTPDMPMPTCWTLYVRVADIEKAVDAVKAHGGKVLNGPMDVPGGDRIAQCLDPQGAAFAMHAVKAR